MEEVFKKSVFKSTNIFAVFLVVLGAFLVPQLVTGAPWKPNIKEQKEELVLVQAIWRHGDRAPARTWASDPDQEGTGLWPQGLGQLTPEGMRQHVVLGQKLRQRYVDELGFLAPHYDAREVYIRSTDYNRTLNSAMANMIGFYGRSARPGVDYPVHQDWPMSFVPVAIHTLGGSGGRDRLNPDDECERHDVVQQLVRQTPGFQKLWDENREVFEELAKYTGQPMEPFDIWWFSDNIRVRRRQNHTLPDWLHPRLEQAVFTMHQQLRRWREGMDFDGEHNGVDLTHEIRRIRGGPILWTLLDNINTKRRCSEKGEGERDPSCKWIHRRRFFGFSAHEVTIQSLFLTLGFNQTNFDRDEAPHYASCVAVELWRTVSASTTNNGTSTVTPPPGGDISHNNQKHHYTVRVRYWPDEHEPVQELHAHIDGCKGNGDINDEKGEGEGCPLEALLEPAQRYRPVLPTKNQNPPESSSTTSTVTHSTATGDTTEFCANTEFHPTTTTTIGEQKKITVASEANELL